MSAPIKRARGAADRRRRRPLRIALWTSAILFAAVAIDCGANYWRIMHFTGVDASDPALRADAGIVLGAALWNDRPSPGLRERLDQALALYRAGVFPHVIVSGGLDAGAAITEAEGMRDYLVERGVPPDAVYLEQASRDTYENLAFSRKIMNAEGWRTAIIVTHRYHAARAADIAKTVDYEPVMVSTAESRVMNMAYHRARETLAFAKWQLTKLRLALP